MRNSLYENPLFSKHYFNNIERYNRDHKGEYVFLEVIDGKVEEHLFKDANSLFEKAKKCESEGIEFYLETPTLSKEEISKILEDL